MSNAESGGQVGDTGILYAEQIFAIMREMKAPNNGVFP